jgi:hypothetical protein
MTWRGFGQVRGTDPVGGALFVEGTRRISLAGSNFSSNHVVVRFFFPLLDSAFVISLFF